MPAVWSVLLEYVKSSGTGQLMASGLSMRPGSQYTTDHGVGVPGVAASSMNAVI